MNTIAKITLWGTDVGAVTWNDEEGLAYFEYDKRFEKGEWNISPLLMPIGGAHRVYSFPSLRRRDPEELNAFNGLPGLLADSLPDKYGNELINAWLASQGREPDSMNPVEKLCFIGTRAMGALQFEPVVEIGDSGSFNVSIQSLVDIASEILSKRNSFATNLQSKEAAVYKILSIGSSVGGARPKAVIAYNEQTGDVRSGQCDADAGYDHWLIKLDGVSDVQLGSSRGWGRVEYAYYLMAKECGVEMMPCQLFEENGRAHFMTKRYDRVGGAERLHTQTMCAINHMDFNRNQSYSYEQLFQIMRQLNLSYPEMEQMFRRMVFNAYARNCDDHTKNHAFIMDKKGQWRLSPAFDICFAYNPANHWVSRHALSVNFKRERFAIADFMEVAKLINCRRPEAIIAEVRDVVSHWEDFAATAGVDDGLNKMICEGIMKDVEDV